MEEGKEKGKRKEIREKKNRIQKYRRMTKAEGEKNRRKDPKKIETTRKRKQATGTRKNQSQEGGGYEVFSAKRYVTAHGANSKNKMHYGVLALAPVPPSARLFVLCTSTTHVRARTVRATMARSVDDWTFGHLNVFSSRSNRFCFLWTFTAVRFVRLVVV